MSFVTFKSYDTLEVAQEIATTLEQKGIQVKLEKDVEPLDITFTGMKQPQVFQIKIAAQDFELANAVLDTSFDVDISEMPKDHYLTDFSIDELMEVVKNKDEWKGSNIIFVAVYWQQNVVSPPTFWLWSNSQT